MQLWRNLCPVLFPILSKGNDVIVVLPNDLVYQSLQVYVTATEPQFTSYFLSNNKERVYSTSNELQLTASFASK